MRTFLLLIISLSCISFASSCGKKGDPKAPGAVATPQQANAVADKQEDAPPPKPVVPKVVKAKTTTKKATSKKSKNVSKKKPTSHR